MPIRDFDARAMYTDMDAQRVQRGLSWAQVARELWAQSIALNQRRQDHPISASTLVGIAKRGDCTCQHALFILRWLGCSPEHFVSGISANGGPIPLPAAAMDQRLRWDLAAVYACLDECRQQRGFTWKALARELRCTDNQLTGIRTARYAVGMVLMMRIVQWTGRPAASFIYAARW